MLESDEHGFSAGFACSYHIVLWKVTSPLYNLVYLT